MLTHTTARTRCLVAVLGIAALFAAVACGGADDNSGDAFSSGGGAEKEAIVYAGAPAPTDSGDGIAYYRSTGEGSAELNANQPQSSGAPGGSTAPSLPALLDRQIIRTATVSIETDTVSRNFEDIGTIATGAGGFVASSSFGTQDDRQIASITVRVPGDRYQDVLQQLRRIGEVKSEQASSNDVTEEFTDLQSRLRNLEASEQRYLDLLGRAENINDILTVQDRINITRAEIEQVQGRINLLGNQTELATITVHLAPPIPGLVPEEKEGSTNPLEAAQEAWEASLAVLLGAAVVVVAIGAFSWWILPLAGLGWYVGRRLQREKGEPASPTSTP